MDDGSLVGGEAGWTVCLVRRSVRHNRVRLDAGAGADLGIDGKKSRTINPGLMWRMETLVLSRVSGMEKELSFGENQFKNQKY